MGTDLEKRLLSFKDETEDSSKSISNKCAYFEQMIKDLESKVKNETSLDEVQILSSKLNQQKAKLIDMEANITMQERSTSKLSDDLKKLNGSVSGSINKLEDRFDKLNKHGALSEDTSSKKT